MSELFDKSIRTLELPRVLQLLSEQAVSPEAKELALAVRPETDYEDVLRLLDQTDGARAMIVLRGAPGFSGVKLVKDLLDRADRGGSLNIPELIRIGDLLYAARRAKEYFNADAAEPTALDQIFLSIHGNRFLEDKIRRCISDENTVAAIKLFEGKHGLVADGEMSAADQQVLYGATAMEASVVVTPSPTPTVKPPTKTLRPGDKDDEVKLLQQRLKDLGYYTGNITGVYNTATTEAVKAFQKKSSLEQDGILGPITRTVLYGVNAIYAVPTAIPVSTPTPTTTPLTPENVIVIRAGSMGEVVRRLQARLQELGYYTSRLDGVYLTDDIEAVRAFQSANGLKVDGKAGYETQTALYSDSAIRGNANVTSGETALVNTLRYGNNTTDTSGTLVNTLRYGSEGNEVTTLQNRLIALGYLAGSADGKFGRDTKSAVIAFQKANGLSADGVVGTDTSTRLYASNVVSNTVSSTQTLRVGAVSDAVRDMQNRLITLGYLENGEADGKFGVKTSLALIEFQKANGLSADGVAGVKTFAKLNSVSAITAGSTGSSTSSGTTTTTAAAPTVTTISASQVRYANWYSEVKARCRLFPNATIYDFTTGISWQVNIFSMGAHADAEPLTARDTAEMNRAFGGKTTWTPKAVWVVLSDGTVYMASTHNTPHDTYHIRDNNFDGHICIHFPRTQAQVEKIGPYATSHQKAIDLGWETTLKLAAYY